MSAGTRNGAPLPERSDNTASRCLAILDAGIASLGIELLPRGLLVGRRQKWRGHPGVLYPDQFIRPTTAGRPCSEYANGRREKILEIYEATRSIEKVRKTLCCGSKVVYRVLNAAGVKLPPPGAKKKVRA